MPTQILSFIISVLATSASLYMCFYGRKEAKLFYLGHSIAWIAGSIYYFFVLFTDINGGHEASSFLRFFQYVIFSGWLFAQTGDNILSSVKTKKKIKKASEKVNKWIT